MYQISPALPKIPAEFFRRVSLETSGALLLALLYVGFYLGDPVLPGNNFDPCCTNGWIGWWDQGRYYASAQALAAGNLDPAQHWYLLGYSVLAAPFSFLRSHRFFLVDLACLLIVYKAFLAFAARVVVPKTVAVVIFLLSVCVDPILFRQWAIPWTSTPSAALIWLLLATTAAHLQGQRRILLIGVLSAALPLFRPADALLSAIGVIWIAASDFRQGRACWSDAGWFLAGAALPTLPYAILHVVIYGWHVTPYMLASKDLGFTLSNPIWRAYVMLIEPRQWYFTGQGVLARAPWLLLGFAGVVWGLLRGGAAALLALCLTAYCLLYLAYVDLLPTTIWQYLAVHYFKWTAPGFALLAWILLVGLYRRQLFAWAALALVFLLTCVRVTPRPAAAGEPALALDFPGIAANEDNTANARGLTLTDQLGDMHNISMMHAYPFPSGNGARLIGLKRDFVGPLSWPPGNGLAPAGEAGPVRRWAEHITIGYPCWLPPHKCKKPLFDFH